MCEILVIFGIYEYERKELAPQEGLAPHVLIYHASPCSSNSLERDPCQPPSEVVIHWSLSSIRGISSIVGLLQSKVIFKWRVSFVRYHLPLEVVIH